MPRLTPDDWAQIRYAYEHTAQPIDEICAGYGISSGTLRDRLRRWGWRRRRPPIPREGPPAFLIVEQTLAPGRDVGPQPRERPDPSHPDPLQIRIEGSDGERDNMRRLQTGDGTAVPALSGQTNAEMTAIVPALHSAVARVIPAIEQAIARLASGNYHSDTMERTARALGALTRTLRELNGLLGQQQRRW
jgi:hypothetical protein